MIYVLLRKPRGDQRLVAKQRDIALMAQGMKVLCRVVLATAFPRIEARLAPEQMGWVKAIGASDAAMLLGLVLQNARACRQPLFVLYIDLATFFPAVHRGVATVAELYAGLPACGGGEID